MDIKDKVKSIIAEQLNAEPDLVRDEATFSDDLGADSLDIVELIMTFEHEFAIKIPEEDAEKLVTVGAVADYIYEHAREGY